uniref:Uncharacterized protein n=1 Tax=Geospiza parvula TaxID=87175 RepID=A0A8C3NL59_GEOPR
MSRPGLLLAPLLALLLLGAGGAPGPAGTPGRLPEDAEQEHGYYLRQLFGAYGENGTLPSEGLARLLGSLGLGRVQVVQIQHEEYRGDPSGTGETPQVPRGPSGTGETSQVPGGPLRYRGFHPRGAALGKAGLSCLNVTQLLGNFGLDSVAQLTPEQFTLLCPALLYQIDSRVCIRHRTPIPHPPSLSLGWALLAVLSVSLPSVLAVLLLPLRARGSFRSLLAFLVALAVGTLCGDALLHLWPHVGPAPGVAPGVAPGAQLPPVLVHLCSLRSRAHLYPDPRPLPVPRSRPCLPSPSPCTELRLLAAPEAELEPRPPEPPRERPPGPPHGHSHGPALPPGPGAADIVWMVVLGDGVHNLSDGLAIGAAFSQSLSSGLSTALAVLCHELPHELGDLAVLLRAGTAPRSLLLLNLLSALLSCLGAVAGVALGRSGTPLAPWLLTATAGVFLYVALADMLPEALRGSAEGTWSRFLLQNAGFLLGAGIMLGIALAEGHLRSWLQP